MLTLHIFVKTSDPVCEKLLEGKVELSRQTGWKQKFSQAHFVYTCTECGRTYEVVQPFIPKYWFDLVARFYEVAEHSILQTLDAQILASQDKPTLVCKTCGHTRN